VTNNQERYDVVQTKAGFFIVDRHDRPTPRGVAVALDTEMAAKICQLLNDAEHAPKDKP
jgi:hypothetical protein